MMMIMIVTDLKFYFKIIIILILIKNTNFAHANHQIRGLIPKVSRIIIVATENFVISMYHLSKNFFYSVSSIAVINI